jgi:hypothetical protein
LIGFVAWLSAFSVVKGGGAVVVLASVLCVSVHEGTALESLVSRRMICMYLLSVVGAIFTPATVNTLAIAWKS